MDHCWCPTANVANPFSSSVYLRFLGCPEILYKNNLFVNFSTIEQWKAHFYPNFFLLIFIFDSNVIGSTKQRPESGYQMYSTVMC